MTKPKPSRHRAIRLRVAFYLFFGNFAALFLALNLWEFVYEKENSYPEILYTILDFYYQYLVWYIAPVVWLSSNMLYLDPDSFFLVTILFIINAAVWAFVVHGLLWLILRKRVPSWNTYRIPKQ